LYYFCLETYKEKAQLCANSLNALFKKGDPIDCLMTTSLDYSAIMNKYSSFEAFLAADSRSNWQLFDFAGAEFEGVSQLGSDSQGLAASSEPCDQICQPEEQKPRMNLEDLSSLADKLDKESVSFEFLEELTKIKEEEIKSLRTVLYAIQKENDMLKDALIEVRTHLIALETNEVALDTLPGT
jgi:hypothetical protein